MLSSLISKYLVSSSFYDTHLKTLLIYCTNYLILTLLDFSCATRHFHFGKKPTNGYEKRGLISYF